MLFEFSSSNAHLNKCLKFLASHAEPLRGRLGLLGKPSTTPDSDFASVLTSTDCSNSEAGLSIENSVGEFSMVPNIRVLSVI